MSVMKATFVINYYQNQPQALKLAAQLAKLGADMNVMIEDNPRLKVMEHGGGWTQRWLTTALNVGGDPIIKIDPDIQVTRAAASFPTADVFGSILTYMDGSTQCHGGTFGVSRKAAQQIVDSKLLLDEKYKTPEYTYKWNGETVSYQDKIFADVCKRLGIKMERWHEVWMQHTQSPYDPKQHAFIHPRVS
jgi:hypothetical protein